MKFIKPGLHFFIMLHPSDQECDLYYEYVSRKAIALCIMYLSEVTQFIQFSQGRENGVQVNMFMSQGHLFYYCHLFVKM